MTLGMPLLICLALVAWLTGAATAVRSVSRIWLRHWVDRQLRGAPSAELYLERPQRLLLAATTGVAAVVLVAGILLGATAPEDGTRLAGRVLLYALLVLVLGQLLPRAIARRWAPTLVPVLLPVLRGVEIALAPVLGLARRATRPLRDRRSRTADEAEHDNLEDLLREGELEGVGEATEIAIISGVVQFGQKTLVEVMTPREEVFAVDESVTGRELASRIAQSGYSRVPIFRGTIDEVIGMVHAFDVLKDADGVRPPIRAVAFAPASARCNQFLFGMLRNRRHLAVVQDEHRRMLGIVTLEDLLEELVGDIRDEHDEPAASGGDSGR